MLNAEVKDEGEKECRKCPALAGPDQRAQQMNKSICVGIACGLALVGLGVAGTKDGTVASTATQTASTRVRRPRRPRVRRRARDSQGERSRPRRQRSSASATRRLPASSRSPAMAGRCCRDSSTPTRTRSAMRSSGARLRRDDRARHVHRLPVRCGDARRAADVLTAPPGRADLLSAGTLVTSPEGPRHRVRHADSHDLVSRRRTGLRRRAHRRGLRLHQDRLRRRRGLRTEDRRPSTALCLRRRSMPRRRAGSSPSSTSARGGRRRRDRGGRERAGAHLRGRGGRRGLRQARGRRARVRHADALGHREHDRRRERRACSSRTRGSRRSSPPVSARRSRDDSQRARSRSRIWRVALAATKLLYDAGVPILAGTDAPNPGTSHGSSLHRELELLVQAGLSPDAALAAATSVPARVYSLRDRGRIAPGFAPTSCSSTAIRAATSPRRGTSCQSGSAASDSSGRRPRRRPRRPPRRRRPAWSATSTSTDIRAEFGSGWQTSTDSLMGGASTATMAIVQRGANETRGALEVSGTLAAGAPYPVGGRHVLPGRDANGAGRSLEVQGDRRSGRGVTAATHQVMVFAARLGNIPATQPFTPGPEWREFVLPLASFSNIDGSDLRGVLFSAGSKPGPSGSRSTTCGFVQVDRLRRSATNERIHEGHDETMNTMKRNREGFIVSFVPSCSSCDGRWPVSNFIIRYPRR